MRHTKNRDDNGLGDSDPSWAQILVTGEMKSNPIEDGQETAWLDLATYAREVFRTQEPRFVLGFTLCGSIMRLWHFDRSGSSESCSFDINDNGFRFIQVILGYHLMNNKQLGLDPTIQHSNGKRFTKISRDDRVERLSLSKEIRKQAAVVGRATTCWRAYCDDNESTEPLVVKDSWQYKERPEGEKLIKEATDKGVRNIARYYHHETVQIDGTDDDTMLNVRGGLMKSYTRTTSRQKGSSKPEAQPSESLEKTPASQSQGRTQSRNQSRSDARKRSPDSVQMAPPLTKRSCSTLRSMASAMHSHNRVHRRVITRNPGRPIYEASSRVAVIKGFIGAISGRYIHICITDFLTNWNRARVSAECRNSSP